MISSYRVPLTASLVLAVTTKESEAWLHALPVSVLGLHVDDYFTRIAVGLHLIVEVMLMPSLLMGSAATKANYIFSQHASINAIINRSLTAVISYHQPLSPLVYAGQMVSDLTGVPLPGGSLVVALL